MSETGYTFQCYKRYGGMSQWRPLTPEEQTYDDTCRAIDDLEAKIKVKSMALFTAGEFLYFSWFTNKTFWGPKQDQLNKQRGELSSLLATLESREK